MRIFFAHIRSEKVENFPMKWAIFPDEMGDFCNFRC